MRAGAVELIDLVTNEKLAPLNASVCINLGNSSLRQAPQGGHSCRPCQSGALRAWVLLRYLRLRRAQEQEIHCSFTHRLGEAM